MKKFIRTALSVLLVFCCTILVACSDPSNPNNPENTPVNLTYVRLENNTEGGFQAEDINVSIAIGVQKGSALKAQIDECLNTLSNDYRYSLMTSMTSLVRDSSATYTIDYDASHDTSNGVLKVGMECAYAPFNWTQNDASNGAVPIANVDGKYANGYDVQIAAKVACALGMQLEIYQYEWDSLIPAVQSGQLSAIIAGMSPTEERSQEVDFSLAYYKSNLVIITREGSQIANNTTLQQIDRDGIKIAAQPGTFHLDALNDQTTNLTVVSSYEDFNTMKMALEAGLIDGYVAEEPTAMSYCVQASA